MNSFVVRSVSSLGYLGIFLSLLVSQVGLANLRVNPRVSTLQLSPVNAMWALQLETAYLHLDIDYLLDIANNPNFLKETFRLYYRPVEPPPPVGIERRPRDSRLWNHWAARNRGIRNFNAYARALHLFDIARQTRGFNRPQQLAHAARFTNAVHAYLKQTQTVLRTPRGRIRVPLANDLVRMSRNDFALAYQLLRVKATYLAQAASPVYPRGFGGFQLPAPVRFNQFTPFAVPFDPRAVQPISNQFLHFEQYFIYLYTATHHFAVNARLAFPNHGIRFNQALNRILARMETIRGIVSYVFHSPGTFGVRKGWGHQHDWYCNNPFPQRQNHHLRIGAQAPAHVMFGAWDPIRHVPQGGRFGVHVHPGGVGYNADRFLTRVWPQGNAIIPWNNGADLSYFGFIPPREEVAPRVIPPVAPRAGVQGQIRPDQVIPAAPPTVYPDQGRRQGTYSDPRLQPQQRGDFVDPRAVPQGRRGFDPRIDGQRQPPPRIRQEGTYVPPTSQDARRSLGDGHVPVIPPAEGVQPPQQRQGVQPSTQAPAVIPSTPDPSGLR